MEEIFTPETITSAGGIIIALYLGYIIWRIQTNHLNHFQKMADEFTNAIKENTRILTSLKDIIYELQKTQKNKAQ